MKHPSLQKVCNLLLLLWLSMAASCAKLELPGEDNGVGEPGGGDVASADTSSALTVAEFSAAPLDEMVWVQGYIVGYLSGTTLSSACYTAEGAGDTNLLLGTAADTQDVEESIPLQLPKDTGIRELLSLSAHPEYLGRRVYVYGACRKYFGVKGLKPVYDFVFPAADAEAGGAETSLYIDMATSPEVVEAD